MDRRSFLTGTAAAAAASVIAGDTSAAAQISHIPVNLSVVEGVEEGLDWKNIHHITLYRLQNGPWRMARVNCDEAHHGERAVQPHDIDLSKVEHPLPWVCPH